MSRFYKRKPGFRKYKDFHEITVEQAIAAVWKGASQKEVSAQFNIFQSFLA